ncbi:alpha-1,3-arabinosyltransferase XAT3-like [Salvia splendens]|nr:alpha-1,3-arabinosyltransferase XAT3-like [Salvia splendens]
MTINTTIKPYARLIDRTIMKNITTLTITTQLNPPPCTHTFDIPAILFSTGGYPNVFHHFSDVLIPLYLTSLEFRPNSVAFLVVDTSPEFISKYKLILKALSNDEIIKTTNNNNYNKVLCFQRVIAGLRSHNDLALPPKNPITDFTAFLRETYSLEKDIIDMCEKKRRRPRLLLVSREETRRLRNEREVAKVARELGFEASVRGIGPEDALVARMVNAFDVMVAVHGAGITNMMYLPERAVLVQIVPVGLAGLGRVFYEEPSRGMNLRYLEYRVSVEESSLSERYGVGDEVFRNTSSFREKGWGVFKSIYMENQDVSVDLVRFRRVLVEAMELVCG